MSKHDVFMPLMIGDFLRDTMRLDVEQQGAYLLLLIDMWCNGPIKNDEKILQKICKFSAHKWEKKSEEILQIFSEKDGFIFHPDLEYEKARNIALHESRSKSGQKGNTVRWSQGDSGATRKNIAEGSHSNSNSNSEEKASPSRAEFNTEPETDAPAPGEGEAVVEQEGLGEKWAAAQGEAAARHEAWRQSLDASAELNVRFEIVVHHDTTRRWLDKGLSVEQVVEAGRIARQRKPSGPIPPKYLETIVDGEFIAPKPENRHARRTNPAAKLSPAEIILAAARDEAGAGILEGECEIIH